MKRLIVCLIPAILSISSCQKEAGTEEKKASLFEQIEEAHSGVSFNNKIVENEQLNFFKYEYLYNGGGVGIGDINNDGLADLYFSSTMGKDQLYLNKGNFEFEDISEKAQINKYSGYKTGVNMVDINQDGWLDIYVCRSGWYKDPQKMTNLLFINQKDGTFKEEASTYGLDDGNHSIQSVFFDYDKDGDLDMYLGNHPRRFKGRMVQIIEDINDPKLEDSDKLYRNDGNSVFTDVTMESGIRNYGFALGLIAADLNNDGWTDIYTTSDFQPRDHYFINQKDGTFKEALEEHFNHISYFAMGSDVVDINNDGALDIFVSEMLAEDNFRQKTNMAPMDMDKFAIQVSNGMYFQYMRNSFQINNGKGYFSDVAPYSGIDKTDWSWSALFNDYDHDGDNDLLVVNGWLKDTQDKDTAKKANKLAQQSNNTLRFDQVEQLFHSTALNNYAFRYDGDLKFTKVSEEWGFNHKGHSHGMAIGDLDNDGDLDIVTNNINEAASIYRNTSNNKDFIALQLNGPDQNSMGLNSKIKLFTSEGIQYKEFQTSRGFQSCMHGIVHFGMSPDCRIDSLEVLWPDGQRQILKDPEKGQYHTINYEKTSYASNPSEPFTLLEPLSLLKYSHKEEFYDDYGVQVLLPHLLSQLGPALECADINKDGLDDIFIGSGANSSSQLFIQLPNGSFKNVCSDVFDQDKQYEDIEAHFFDYDQDGLIDLYVGSGSTEFYKKEHLNRDRIYRNKGNNKFEKLDILPEIEIITGTVSSIDLDNDGDLDLFVGGRVVASQYPEPAPSYLLLNENGRFIDRTDQLLNTENDLGLITCSAVFDINQDGYDDIIYGGEWTGINLLMNTGGAFELKELSAEAGKGWWNSIKIADLDGDGNADLLLGNLGLNYKYKASKELPFEVYSSDIDQNGINDIVLGYYSDDNLYPVRGFQCSSEQIPDLKNSISSYAEFGSMDLLSIYGDRLENSKKYIANNFSSGILWNLGNGKFEFKQFDYRAQLAPIQDFELLDIDKDGDMDIIGAGNWFVSEIETPRADAGTGFILKNNGNRNLSYVQNNQAGIQARHDVRNLAQLTLGKDGKACIVVANNNNDLQFFRVAD